MRPDDSNALLSEAGRLATAGDAAGAFGVYRDCARRHPLCAPAWRGMSDLLLARGDHGAATQVLSHAMAALADDDAGRALIAPAFVDRLAGLRPDAWHASLDRDLLALWREPGIERQRLARITAVTLVAKPDTGGEAEAVLDRIATDPLWLAFLSGCLNVDAAMEARLVVLRHALLDAHAAGAPLAGRAGLACALALQAFAGEYVWPIADDETAPLARAAALAEDDLDALLLTCLYRPPQELAPSEAMIARLEALGDAGRLLAQRTLNDLRTETGLARTVPTLQAGDGAMDAVSIAVRAQYEANPYPRWAAPPQPRLMALRDHVVTLPKVDVGRLPAGPLRVLIAGCGTGYEAVDMARMDPTLAITALDLSRASLAYGARMAQALGVANIAFRHGNILDLSARAPTFDVATSTGVLHHMDEPAAGLRAIAQAVKPGGAVRIALYSERARAPVVAAHDLIRSLGLRPTPDGVRAFRSRVLAAPAGSPLAALQTSDDLYSISGCRDLAFHAHERRFTLPQAGALLEGAGLTLIGLDAPPPAIAAFQRSCGAGADRLDLALWDRVEARHPSLFVGMYALWGQKAGSPIS